ncbi:MAG: hypothetical protein OCD01_08825 [Fibrobacterales bacterium]
MKNRLDSQGLTRAITKTLVILVFWGVLGISLFIRDTITINDLLFDLAKSLVVCGVFWILFLIISDTLVKSMIHSAKSESADRFEGEMTFHVTQDTPEERQWQRQFKGKEDFKNKS